MIIKSIRRLSLVVGIAAISAALFAPHASAEPTGTYFSFNNSETEEVIPLEEGEGVRMTSKNLQFHLWSSVTCESAEVPGLVVADGDDQILEKDFDGHGDGCSMWAPMGGSYSVEISRLNFGNVSFSNEAGGSTWPLGARAGTLSAVEMALKVPAFNLECNQYSASDVSVDWWSGLQEWLGAGALELTNVTLTSPEEGCGKIEVSGTFRLFYLFGEAPVYIYHAND